MTNQAGSVFGGALLIAGSCIGAGMLALPILTGIPGFFPAVFMLITAWLFMLVTSFLIVEVVGWFEGPVNLMSMVGHLLGPIGKVISCLLYLFLFYSLLVAYISASGGHVSLLADRFLHLDVSHSVGSVCFVALFGWVVYFGTKPVDHLNRFLMYGKVGAFAILVIVGIGAMTPSFLFHWNPKYAFFTFPILIVSFGFHNMVPVLMQYMQEDRKRVRQSIWIGSLLTMTIYLVWEIVTLGTLPFENILRSYHMDIDGAQALLTFLQSRWIGYSAQALAFFSILTSFLAQALSLAHFLNDGLKFKQKNKENSVVCLLCLIPPLAFSIIFPHIFFRALNFGGGICAIVLFGLFPVLMVWVGRYRKRLLLEDKVPGGRFLLFCVFSLAIFLFLNQFASLFQIDFLPKP